MSEKREEQKVNVGIYVREGELDEMRRAARVDANGPAVLAMARRGLEAEKAAGRLA